MSSFDDEFGLFGDDAEAPEEERRSTLGARRISSNDSFGDDIEPEDERPLRRRGPSDRKGGEGRPYRERDRGPRPAGDPAVAQARAVELLRFLAAKLVSRSEDVIVEVVEGSRGPIIELEVHPEDFGKVIGKGGRVAQALRTIVRASAEGRVTIDIVDVADDDVHESDLEHAGDTSTVAPTDVMAQTEAEIALGHDEPEPEPKPAAKKKAAKKTTTAAKKRGTSAAAAPRRKKKS